MSASPELPRDRLRLALIGCGRIARLHCERIAADGRAAIVAMFDPDPEAAAALRDWSKSDTIVCQTFESLLQRSEFDAAVIASPTHLHFEQASAVMRRGLPVLCEKPLARTRQEIVELAALSTQRGTLLSVAYQRRLWASYRTLRKLVRSGDFGPVRAVLSHNVESWQPMIGGTWRDDPAMNPGGFIGDAGSHKIDAVFYTTGLEPTEIFARTDQCGSRVEVVASVTALLSGGVPLTMDFIGQAQQLGELLSVHCADADLALRDGELWMSRAGKSERVQITEPESNPIAAFVDSVLGGAENFAPPQCALPVFDFTQGLLASAREGRSVSLR